ncbi:hypothetical protein RYX56_06380 [Alkalihalophilus lindianensis]|uniref:Uncharacterized protein n=1 Tax=Alkalihalophilus lindianensis TaxID=1630542 RepID=A0ABU3X856_9BACI|nr:hypothetical protein [Alkalihalophilus lindianensis]MDV2683998.1 hypothetical protein [Alkalihalophilus lindianensis]
MKKPRTPFEKAIDFIEGRITEKEYLSEKTRDSAGREILDRQDLPLLKEDMSLFRKYLLTLSLQGRFTILLRREFLGMPQTSLVDKYGINKDKIRILKGQHHPSKVNKKVAIRPINSNQDLSNELLANLAIFWRVPISWIQPGTPEQSWTIDHFKYLPDPFFSVEQFHVYLNQTEELALKERIKIKHTKPNHWVYDVRGVILKISAHQNIYLRVAIWENGGFIIEIFSINNELNDFVTLKEILQGYGPLKVGYCYTVIKNRINIVIIAKSRSENFTIPNEVRDFN